MTPASRRPSGPSRLDGHARPSDHDQPQNEQPRMRRPENIDHQDAAVSRGCRPLISAGVVTARRSVWILEETAHPLVDQRLERFRLGKVLLARNLGPPRQLSHHRPFAASLSWGVAQPTSSPASRRETRSRSSSVGGFNRK